MAFPMNNEDWIYEQLQNQQQAAQQFASQAGLQAYSGLGLGLGNAAYSCAVSPQGPTNAYPIRKGTEIKLNFKESDLKKKKGKSMIKQFQDYISEHKDIVFSVLLLFLCDKVFLNGALQEKLASFVHKLVEGMEKRVSPTEGK